MGQKHNRFHQDRRRLTIHKTPFSFNKIISKSNMFCSIILDVACSCESTALIAAFVQFARDSTCHVKFSVYNLLLVITVQQLEKAFILNFCLIAGA